MAKLVFERALHEVTDPATNESKIVSYWDRVSLEKLASNYADGPEYFGPSYMNDPGLASGNLLKRTWLQPYLVDQLYEARSIARVQHGIVYAGVDTTEGGDHVGADYCTMAAGERVGGILYLKTYRMAKLSVEHQAQRISDWLDAVNPTLTTIEDRVTRGYVWRALSTEVNGGSGTKHAFLIDKPKGSDQGSKVARFMSMGARFSSGRILVPGIADEDGNVTIDPSWFPFVEQWTSFPAGKDDLLDAVYWCVETAFKGTIKPASIIRGSSGSTGLYTNAPSLDGITCPYPEHVNYERPIDQCRLCTMKLVTAEAERIDDYLRHNHGATTETRGKTLRSELAKTVGIGVPSGNDGGNDWLGRYSRGVRQHYLRG